MNKNIDLKSVENSVKNILGYIGEDPEREGLKDTPKRVAKSYEFLTSGYNIKIEEIVNGAIFQEGNKGMVIVQDIELYSLCEHHLLPFYGKACVAYIPNEKIIGLSKIPRIVDMFARRLQVQERLTDQISNALWDILQPHGVAVVIEAKHLCMMMRGVEKQNSFMTTSSVLGEFHDSQPTRMEFLSLIRKKN
ncbi:MAG: GTP cyclohydrolase I FolE [Spirochaetia bacterium]|nr:GTP cyclohydrolase I FolE [Spirochaetia bacterium]